MFDSKIRRLAGVTMLALTPLLTTCGDDPVLDPEPEVETMRLIIVGPGPATDTVDVASTGTVTGGPITMQNPGTRSVAAEWLKADGTPETLVNSTDFQLNVLPANTGVVTFTRTGAFAGTLTGVADGSTTIDFSLYHNIEMHDDFGPFPVSITLN